MIYKHAYLNTLLLLHSAFMLSLVKMLLKGEVGGHALIWELYCFFMENHGIVFLNFSGDPDKKASSNTETTVTEEAGDTKTKVNIRKVQSIAGNECLHLISLEILKWSQGS